MSKLDLKNDPKFLARVQQLNAKQFMRVLKEPVELTVHGGLTAYVTAIGLNGSYCVVIPGRDVDGVHAMGEIMFCVYQTEKHSTAAESEHISKFMSMWLITSTESDFDIVKHRDFDIIKNAIKTIENLRGPSYFDTGKEDVFVNIQGVITSIKNPCSKHKR